MEQEHQQLLSPYLDNLPRNEQFLIFEAIHSMHFKKFLEDVIAEKTTALKDLNYSDAEVLQDDYKTAVIELDTLQDIVDFIDTLKQTLSDGE